MAGLADLGAASDPFPNDALLISGPGFSGSLHSLLPVVSAIMDAPKIHRPGRILVRSSGFTSCGTAAFVAKAIAQQFNVDVDMGSALHPIASWTGFALRTLEEIGIERRGVAIVSEGESLFGESVENLPNEGQNPSEQREWIPKCNSESPAALSERPWNLEFPRDIAALR